MRLLAAAVVVLALLGLAELLGPRLVEDIVASRVQDAAGLAERPEVEVRERPFLLQALKGRYEDVVVRATDVPAGMLELDSLVTQLTAVEVPLAKALTGQVDAVPVGRLSTRAVIGYDDLSAAVEERSLRLSSAGPGLVRVTRTLDVLGQTLEASAVSRPSLVDSTLVVTAERFEVGSRIADALLSRALGNQLDFRVELEALPYGLQPRSVDASPRGVVVLAQAVDTVLG